jgi:hypothetical protein
MRKSLHSMRVRLRRSGQARARVGTLRCPRLPGPGRRGARIGAAAARIPLMRRRYPRQRTGERKRGPPPGRWRSRRRQAFPGHGVADPRWTDGAAPAVEHAFSAALTCIDAVYAIEHVNAYNADVASLVEVQDFWRKRGQLPGFAIGK